MSLNQCGVNPPLDLSPQRRELKPQGTLDFPLRGLRRALRPRPRPLAALALARRVRGHLHPVGPADGGDPRRLLPSGPGRLHRHQHRGAALRQHRRQLRDTVGGVQPRAHHRRQGHRLCQKVHRPPWRGAGPSGPMPLTGRPRPGPSRPWWTPATPWPPRTRATSSWCGPNCRRCAWPCAGALRPTSRRGRARPNQDEERIQRMLNLHPGALRPPPSPWPASPGPPASASGSACAASARPSTCPPMQYLLKYRVMQAADAPAGPPGRQHRPDRRRLRLRHHPSNFSQQFRRFYGCSPREYRARKRG